MARGLQHHGQFSRAVSAIEANADSLARYAAISQEAGIVPIVEPEVLMDGDHSIERSAEVTEAVLHEVFDALHRHRVVLEHILLKPSMVLAGSENARQSSTADIAAYTVRILKRTVPSAVPGIVFLSGGQSPEEATANLDAMNRLGPLPWNLSSRMGARCRNRRCRHGKARAGNVEEAQQALLKRARLNSAAALGKYDAAQEKS